MKVLFEFSRSGFPKYLESFEKIKETLLTQKHILTNDLLSEEVSMVLSPKVFKRLNKAISMADCVIIEGSTISLSVSYVLTQAIFLNKPVLFLSHSKSPDIDRSRFVKVIDSKLLTVGQYENSLQIPDIITKFFKETKYIKTRFNLVLPSNINSFVTSESIKKQISKTEYILGLIQKEINE